MPSLEKLIEFAKRHKMTPAEIEAQRQSFAYGNCHIENPLVTREMVAEASKRLADITSGDQK